MIANSSFKRVFQFYLFTCTISFASALPVFLYANQLWPWEEVSISTIRFLSILYAYGPLLGVSVVFLLPGNSTYYQDWKNRLLNWNVPIKWYALSIFIPFFSIFLIILTFQSFLPKDFVLPKFTQLSTSLTASIYYVFVGGPVSEEPGWRGFAQPILEKELGVLRASLIVGVLWYVWHIPTYVLTKFQLWDGIIGLLLFGLIVITVSIIIGFIVYKTQSTLMAILFHASFNTSFVFVDLFLKDVSPLLTLSALVIIYLLVILVFYYHYQKN